MHIVITITINPPANAQLMTPNQKDLELIKKDLGRIIANMHYPTTDSDKIEIQIRSNCI